GRFCLRRCSLSACGSSHQRKQPVPAYRPRPAPYHPGMLALANREENDLCLAHEILKRHVPDLTEDAAVCGIVAIIAHHEIVPLRHLIDGRIVVEAIIDKIERRIAHAVRQCLSPALDPRGARAFLSLDVILDALPL